MVTSRVGNGSPDNGVVGSLGHRVTRSLGHRFTGSPGHGVTAPPGHRLQLGRVGSRSGVCSVWGQSSGHGSKR